MTQGNQPAAASGQGGPELPESIGTTSAGPRHAEACCAEHSGGIFQYFREVREAGDRLQAEIRRRWAAARPLRAGYARGSWQPPGHLFPETGSSHAGRPGLSIRQIADLLGIDTSADSAGWLAETARAVEREAQPRLPAHRHHRRNR